ncbi:hypothetical protein OPV22_034692 [Ensete ventricosum]|uniref:Transposase n=1 Tax=Ensete ventricosum TaxID=4639 RepID=A0AAV8P4K3_ENSVE|nr:hypothetical protein OPV22_034692 [Ensete ventricosum]
MQATKSFEQAFLKQMVLGIQLSAVSHRSRSLLYQALGRCRHGRRQRQQKMDSWPHRQPLRGRAQQVLPSVRPWKGV